MQIFRRSLVLCALLGAAACGDSKPVPPAPTPTPDPPTLSCPASAALISPDGAPMPLTFTVPTAVGGQLPVPVTCSRLSGSTFPLGSTIVTCTAVDALARQASCNFAVTVTALPRISKTRFLAFGDSITNGRCGPKPDVCDPYSVRLDALLRARYTAQTFVMVNRAVNGETAATVGEYRLPDELNAYSPEVLLLMEGTNDLNGGASQVPGAIRALENMIDMALSRGMKVVIATIPPIAPGGASQDTIPLVAPFNVQIRNLAARKGPDVALADVYAVLNADVPRYYVPSDDLHPNAEGHRVIGDTFYTAVRALLDVTPTAGPAFESHGVANLIAPPQQSSPTMSRRVARR